MLAPSSCLHRSERERKRERERWKESEKEKDGRRGRKRERIVILKGMAGVLAPFSYLVL